MGAPEKRSVPGQWVFRSIFGTVEVLLTVFTHSKIEVAKSRNENKIETKFLILHSHRPARLETSIQRTNLQIMARAPR